VQQRVWRGPLPDRELPDRELPDREALQAFDVLSTPFPITQSSDVDTPTPLKVYVLSGGTGRTADNVLRSALAQFSCPTPQVIRHIQVRSVNSAVNVVQDVAAAKGVLFHTLVEPDVRAAVTETAKLAGIPTFDILGPALALLEDFMQVQAHRAPGLSRELRRAHFDRIDAVDFTLAHDDGLLASELKHADVVLVGVSRVSKSVTCFYLACRGIRAANVPFVGCQDPPEHVVKLDPNRVVALTMNPRRLKSLRETRAEMLGGGSHQQYVDQREVARELRHTNALVEKYGWHCIDVSYKSVEEVAQLILQLVGLKRGPSVDALSA